MKNSKYCNQFNMGCHKIKNCFHEIFLIEKDLKISNERTKTYRMIKYKTSGT